MTAYPHSRLQRIFTQDELTYAFAVESKTAERLAVRFAAREAWYKAFSALYPDVSIPLLTVLRAVTVSKHTSGAPHLAIAWDSIGHIGHEIDTVEHSLSLTHTESIALATVILWRLDR